jgi:hypothetical protein
MPGRPGYCRPRHHRSGHAESQDGGNDSSPDAHDPSTRIPRPGFPLPAHLLLGKVIFWFLAIPCTSGWYYLTFAAIESSLHVAQNIHGAVPGKSQSAGAAQGRAQFSLHDSEMAARHS